MENVKRRRSKSESHIPVSLSSFYKAIILGLQDIHTIYMNRGFGTGKITSGYFRCDAPFDYWNAVDLFLKITIEAGFATIRAPFGSIYPTKTGCLA